MILDEWQSDVVTTGLAELAGGQWAALMVVLLAARRNGKNWMAIARELYGLCVLGEEIIHTAQLFKTAKEAYYDLEKVIMAGPASRMLVGSSASAVTGFTFKFANGGKIDFLARSKNSGRGLNADLLVFDEAQDLTDDEQAALLPTQAARPNPQTWYLGTAPWPNDVLWQRLRRQGRENPPPMMAYFEYSADPDADLNDRDVWLAANPALALGRLNMSVVDAERATMSDEVFARERLSISPDSITVADEIAAKWPSCLDPTSAITGRYVFGIDVALNGTSAAIAASGLRPDGLEHVEIVMAEPGTDWVLEAVQRLADLHKGAAIVIDDRGPAGELLAPLVAAGLQVYRAQTREAIHACGSFLTSVRDGKLRHRGQRSLDAAVNGAKRRQVGDAWLWGRKNSNVDISPLVAATLARWAFTAVNVEPPKPLVFAY